MVNINPISNDLDGATDNVGSNIQNDQPQDQSFMVQPTVPAPVPPTNSNDIASINNVNNRDILEEKKIRNELITINVFAVLGIVSCSVYLISILLNTTNMKALSINSFFTVCDLLLFVFILRKTDFARKIAIFFGYFTFISGLITLLLAGFSLKTTIGLAPNIIFAIFVICFLGSGRIKRHFA